MADTPQPKTTLEQLLDNQLAITNVESGVEEYSMDGVMQKYPSIKFLYAERDRLKKEYANISGAKPRVSYARMDGAAW